jgi:hypothetical protein
MTVTKIASYWALQSTHSQIFYPYKAMNKSNGKFKIEKTMNCHVFISL